VVVIPFMSLSSRFLVTIMRVCTMYRMLLLLLGRAVVFFEVLITYMPALVLFLFDFPVKRILSILLALSTL
jgi:hypothetical protein